MTDIFKSNSAEAGKNRNTIISAAAKIQEGNKSIVSLTNLSIIDKINEINSMMNACNRHYRQLLENHAENIGKIAQEFDDFDKGISDNMTLS